MRSVLFERFGLERRVSEEREQEKDALQGCQGESHAQTVRMIWIMDNRDGILGGAWHEERLRARCCDDCAADLF